MKRTDKLKKMRYGSISALAILLILGFWSAFTYGGVMEGIFLPKPGAVLTSIWEMAKDGTLGTNIWISVCRVMIGWFWSAVASLVIGIVMVYSKTFKALLQPIIGFVRYLPVVALVPITILYCGIGEGQKYTIIFIGTFFQLVLMVFATVCSVVKNLIYAARTLGAKPWYTALHVIFPASLPGILDAFRVTVGWAWTYLVVAEMVAAETGIGYMVIRYQRYLKTDKIFAGVLMIGLIGLVTDAIFRLITKMLVPWHERLGD
jgi:NitT/TauT family transport system permease protein